MPQCVRTRPKRRRGFVLLFAIFFMILLDLIGTALIGMVPTEMLSEGRSRIDTQGHYAAMAGIQHAKQWVTDCITPGTPGELSYIADDPTSWHNGYFTTGITGDPMSAPNSAEFLVQPIANVKIGTGGYQQAGIAALGYKAGDIDTTTTLVLTNSDNNGGTPDALPGGWQVVTTIVPDPDTPGGVNAQPGTYVGGGGVKGSRCYQVVSVAIYQGIPKMRAKAIILEDSFARFARYNNSLPNGLVNPDGSDASWYLQGANQVTGPQHTNTYFRLTPSTKTWNLPDGTHTFTGVMSYAGSPNLGFLTNGTQNSIPNSGEVPSIWNQDGVAWSGGNNPNDPAGQYAGTAASNRPFANSGSATPVNSNTDNGSLTGTRYDRIVGGGASNIIPVSAVSLPTSTSSIATAAFGDTAANLPDVGAPVVPGQGTNGIFINNNAATSKGGVFIRGDVAQMMLEVVNSNGVPVTATGDLASMTGSATYANPAIRLQMSQTISVTTGFTTTPNSTGAYVTHPAVTHGAVTTPAVTHAGSTTPAVTHAAVTTPAVTHAAVTHAAVTHAGSTVPATTTAAVTHNGSTVLTIYTTSTYNPPDGGSPVKTVATTLGSTTPTTTTPGTTSGGSSTPASTTPASTTAGSTTPANTTPASTTAAVTVITTTTPATTAPAGTTPATTTGGGVGGGSTVPTVVSYNPIDRLVQVQSTGLTIQPTSTWNDLTATTAGGGSQPWSRSAGHTDTGVGADNTIVMAGMTVTQVLMMPAGGGAGIPLTGATTINPPSSTTGLAVLMKQSRTDPNTLEVSVIQTGSGLNGAVYAENNIQNLDGVNAVKQTIASNPTGVVPTQSNPTSTVQIQNAGNIGVSDNIFQFGTAKGSAPVDSSHGLGLVTNNVNITARQNTGNSLNSGSFNSADSLYLYGIVMAGYKTGSGDSGGGMEANGNVLLLNNSVSGNTPQSAFNPSTDPNNSGTNYANKYQWGNGLVQFGSGQPPKLALFGGLIEAQQHSRGVGDLTGPIGWGDAFTYDQQLANSPPPYFPTNGLMIPLAYAEERISW